MAKILYRRQEQCDFGRMVRVVKIAEEDYEKDDWYLMESGIFHEARESRREEFEEIRREIIVIPDGCPIPLDIYATHFGIRRFWDLFSYAMSLVEDADEADLSLRREDVIQRLEERHRIDPLT